MFDPTTCLQPLSNRYSHVPPSKPCIALLLLLVAQPLLSVRPDKRYYSRSKCFHPDPGTKHISVPPRHMTKSYAPDFQHDITTLQVQGYNISYNRHTTASNTIQQRKIHV